MVAWDGNDPSVRRDAPEASRSGFQIPVTSAWLPGLWWFFCVFSGRYEVAPRSCYTARTDGKLLESISADENIMAGEEELFLFIESLGHAALVFINKRLIGFGYGNHDDPSFSFSKLTSLQPGNNTLEIMSMMIGLQNFGPWFDVAGAGLFSVILSNLRKEKIDISSREWTYQVGLKGETIGLETVSLSNSSLWTQGTVLPVNQSLIWYKATFRAPEGRSPIALNLASMGKGQAWVNGQGIGRYWPAYHSPPTGCNATCDYRGVHDPSTCQKNCGQPTQTLYHIPRSWLLPDENLLVLLEELGGDPSKISLLMRTGQEICAHVSEADPPPADSWKPKVEYMSQSPEVQLSCEQGWQITTINFASFGTPEGSCGTFRTGICHADMLSVAQEACIGQVNCSLPISTANFGDPCPGMVKSIAIEALCSD